jgi:type IV secretory pathway VirB10-like protein
MNDKIIKALRELDVNNDNHWTDAGLPRVETVRMLAGNGSLSRDDVTAVAPEFTRQKPNLETAATSAPAALPVPTPPPAPVTPAAAPAAPVPAGETRTAAAETSTSANDAMPVEATASEGVLAEASELSRMQNYLSTLEGELDALQTEMDKVRKAIDNVLAAEAEKPAEDPMQAWKKSLEKDVERRIAFQSEFGSKLKALGDLPKLRTPLDSAMAAQNDRKRREGNR